MPNTPRYQPFLYAIMKFQNSFSLPAANVFFVLGSSKSPCPKNSRRKLFTTPLKITAAEVKGG